MKLIKTTIACLFMAASSLTLLAQNTVWVGGEQMYPAKNIIENAVKSADHTTLVAAGLVETLSGKGPFTVFAPTNAAFAKLPDGTVTALLIPENKAKLTAVLTYHVVAGKMDANAIMKAIRANNGKAEFKTVSGATLTAMMNGEKNIVLKDEQGNVSNISIYDVYQSNGVIHVIDSVLLPK